MILTTDQELNTSGWSSTAIAFLARRDEVLAAWESQVRARIEAARAVRSPVLVNTLPAFYDNIAQALNPASAREDATDGNNAASAHGGERARMTEFGPDQIIEEYQIFRQSIVAATAGTVSLSAADWTVIDTSIDKAMVEAVRTYTATHDNLRRRLAAALSHDMRTPLTVISNGTHILKMATSLERIQSVTARIDDAVHRLNGMMGELLDALTESATPRLPLQLGEFEMQGLLAELLREFDAAYPGRFEIAGSSVTGMWDRAALRRALDNLINNALKYGDGGAVRIKADGIRGRLILTVHNTGAVIPAERQDLIFHYLHRESVSGGQEGRGIGLDFVKNVAESHGGSVAVDSAAERGTTFLIDIPIDCRPYVDGGGRP